MLPILLILVFIQSAYAQDLNDVELKERAMDLAECAGIFSAVSNLMSTLEKENASQAYEDTARGAYLSAAFLNYNIKNIPKWEDALSWAKNIQEVRKTYWLGLLELHTPTEKEVFPDSFNQKLSYCAALGPLQTELVSMMREEIYSNN